MTKIEGKYIAFVLADKTMHPIREFTATNAERLFEVEQYINTQVDAELMRKFGISIRVHV